MVSKKGVVPFREVLTDLLTWLKQTSTRAMIIGGVAQAIVAQPRATQDIDVLISASWDQLERLFKSGKKFGFSPRLANALDFAKRNRVLLFRHAGSQIDVDISWAALPFEEESFERLTHVRMGKLVIPLPTPEDLMIMKAVAHRPKDLVDIEAIIATHKKIDYTRVKKWVSEFANALAAPEIYSDLLKIITQKK